MEGYKLLTTEEYRLFANYIVQYNTENVDSIAFETIFSVGDMFDVRLLNKDKLFLEKILVDMV
tara:strand:+ start:765 stop:953 length:189 start_codon:yes stop_codon:yes gene_type:complete